MICVVYTLQRNVDKDQVKAAIKAQQDQQIDNASTLTTSGYAVTITLIALAFSN